jgi:hypothetical protein
MKGSHGSSVDIAMGKEPGCDSQQGQEIFLFSIRSRMTLEPTQHPIQWVPNAAFPEVKRQGREADHSLPSSAEVKNDGAPSPICLHGVVLNYLTQLTFF